MKNFKRAAALLLCVLLVLSLCACGGTSYGNYRVLESFGEQQYSIGFRTGDSVRYYVEAALRVLAADGTVHQLALQWFSEDPTTFTADASALDGVALPQRTLIVGVDAEAFPVSYADGDGYSGFDEDLARAVCDKLGWQIKFQPIESGDAYVELSSGNVDCAWGGLTLDADSGDLSVLGPYMTNELVLVVRRDSGIRSARGLKGKTLAMDVDERYMTALSSDEKLLARLGSVTRLTGGTQRCFTALDAGEADAILTNRIAVAYYGR